MDSSIFKVGDKVRLTKHPSIDVTWQGKRGVVISVRGDSIGFRLTEPIGTVFRAGFACNIAVRAGSGGMRVEKMDGLLDI